MSIDRPEKTDKNTLGEKVAIPSSPHAAAIDVITIDKSKVNYGLCVRLTCPEFTSLCPVTGQPDFAHIVIDYIPHKHLIESKGIKLFLHSFRNHAGFHEGVVATIASRCMIAAAPKWFRIGAYFYPRGGIPIDVFWQSGDPPEGVWIPPQDVPAYRGR